MQTTVARYPSFVMPLMGPAGYSGPSISANGTLYVGSGSSLMAVDAATQSVMWSYTVGGGVYSTPAIRSDGAIVFGSLDDSVYCVSSAGDLLWSYPTAGNVLIGASIGVGDVTFVGSLGGKFYSLSPSGVKLWEYDTSDLVLPSPALSADGSVYVGSYSNMAYAFSSGGSLKWTRNLGHDATSSPAIDLDGSVYFATRASNLHRLDPTTGSDVWVPYTASGQFFYSSPAIDAARQRLYIGSFDDHLHAISTVDGSSLWQFPICCSLRSSPAITSAGVVVVGSSEGNTIYAVNPDGTLAWSVPTGGYVHSSAAIAADDSTYISSNDGNLYHIVPYSLIHLANRTVTVAEHATSVSIQVLRDGMDTAPSLTVDLILTDGTAASPADYISTPVTVAFSPGVTAQTVSIPIVYDAVYGEKDESFNVALANLVLLSGDEAWIADAPYNTTAVTIVNVDPLASPPLAPLPPVVAVSTFAATGTVTISWAVPAVATRGNLPVLAYEILRDGLFPIGPPTTQRSMVDAAVSENTVYTYTLRFNTSLGQSPVSTGTTITTPFRAPNLVAVVPPVVPPSGATTLTLSGLFFGASAADVSAVFIDGTNATTPFTWISDTTVIAYDAATSVVSGSSTQVQLAAVDRGTSNSVPVSIGFAPNVTHVSPSSTANTTTGGVSVLILGFHLGLDTADLGAISLAGIPCASFTRHNSTAVTCVAGSAPPQGASGPVAVTTGSGGSIAALSFVYTASPVASTAPELPNTTSIPPPLPLPSFSPTPSPTPSPTQSPEPTPPPPDAAAAMSIGSVEPSLLPLAGGQIVITGASFGSFVDVTIAFAASQTTTDDGGGATSLATLQSTTVTTVLSNVSTSAAGTAVAVRATAAPSTGYATVTVTRLDGANGTARRGPSATSRDAIHYSDGCLREGFFGTSADDCQSCPAGATCPGGNRVWPQGGFWNPGEEAGFVAKCRPAERCLGGRSSACAPGHTGDLCSTCINGYIAVRGMCVSCPSQPSVIAYIVGDILVWGLVAMSAWFMKSMHDFQRVVAFVCVLQSAGQFSSLLTAKMRAPDLRRDGHLSRRL
jgi:outer membrane protein assembly factor BamB